MTLTAPLIEIVVADMPTALAFYRDLGMQIPADADSEPHTNAEVGGVTLAFDTIDVIRSFDQSWTPATGGHRVALAFDCGSPAEVDATYARMTGAGHQGHLEPWDAFWGMRYAVLHDPDGNPVDLYAALPS